MNKNPYLSIVVPLYNEEDNVALLHEKICTAAQSTGKTYEIIFVDDGSTDTTGEKIKKLTPVRLIVFRKNFGQTAAFDAGFKAARGEVIITMDGDMQNDPADIPRLLEKITQGYDIVSGWRYKRKDPLSKKVFSRIADRLRKLLLRDTIHDSGCSLKAYTAQSLQSVDLFGEMHRFIPALLELDGYNVAEVKVTHHPRVHGKTKYNWKRGVKGFVDMIFLWFWRKYASRPVHFFGGGGIFLICAGSIILMWMVFEKVFFQASLSDRIWPLMGVFLIMLGVQFFIFGLLADIMMKNYYRIRGRMNYAIKYTKEND